MRWDVISGNQVFSYQKYSFQIFLVFPNLLQLSLIVSCLSLKAWSQSMFMSPIARQKSNYIVKRLINSGSGLNGKCENIKKWKLFHAALLFFPKVISQGKFHCLWEKRKKSCKVTVLFVFVRDALKVLRVVLVIKAHNNQWTHLTKQTAKFEHKGVQQHIIFRMSYVLMRPLHVTNRTSYRSKSLDVWILLKKQL